MSKVSKTKGESNYQKLFDAELTTTVISNPKNGYIGLLNKLDPQLVEQIIIAAADNYARLRFAGLTTQIIDGDEDFQKALRALPRELVAEIIEAAEQAKGHAGDDGVGFT